MAKITLTRSDELIETEATVKITGTNLKNKYLFIELADKKHWAENPTFTIRVATVKITNDTTFTYTFKPSQTKLNDVYQNTSNTNKLKTNIFVSTSYTVSPTTNYSFTSYIEEEFPEFDEEPTYKVIDNETLALTNNDQVIINGMSTVEISNIKGTAYKNGYIKYIEVGDKRYNYNDYIQENKIIINNITIPQNESFYVSLIDSRGWDSSYECVVNPWESEFKLYHKPIIKNITVERSGITPTTTLSVSGVYTEGYEEGIETLIPTYKYQEIKSDGSGTIENGLSTQFNITRRVTTEWEDYLAILEEDNNPSYLYDENHKSYYRKSIFESETGIKKLFNIALKYNNKYTEAYLKKDYDEINKRYYIKSGDYYSWWDFWEDTLVAIKRKMYGSYIYGKEDKNYGNGGNYEFEIEYSSIRGDIIEGFSLDKTFNILAYINENTNKETMATTVLSTAIPAIDVYKDKVTLHGLYDETISDSDVQLWGNIFLNGSKINAGLIQILQTANADFSTNYQYFCPFAGDTDVSLDFSFGDKLTLNRKTVAYGDRTSNNVYGITIGSNVSIIKVNFSIRYMNNHSSSVAVNTLISKVRDNQTADIMYGSSTTIPSSSRLTQTGSFYLEVEEGDFIFLAGFRSIKSADVNVIATDNATNMSVEIIS